MRLLVSGLVLFAAAAQLTLPEAVERAIAHSPAVAAASAEADAAAAAAKETRSTRAPSLTFGGTVYRYSDPMVATPIHGFTPLSVPAFDRTLVQSSLSASHVLFDAGARAARIEESLGIAAAANAGTDAARRRAALRAVIVYASVLGRSAAVRAQDVRLQALEAERGRVVQFEKAGRAPHVDLLRVEAALASAEAERVAAAAALDAAERELARLIDAGVDATRAANLAPVADETAALPDRASLDESAEGSPVLRQARLRSVALRESISAARAGRWPQVQATASQLSFATDRSILEHEWNAGLQMRFPVFDNGATTARVARATAAAAAADEQYRTARMDLALSLDRAIAEFEGARAVAASLRKAVERFEEVVRVEKLRLDHGAGVQSDYLRAEADLAAARASVAMAESNITVARASVASITGALDAAWAAETYGRTP